MNPYGTPVPGAINLVDPYPFPKAEDLKPGRIMIQEDYQTSKTDGKPWQFDARMVPLWDKEIATASSTLKSWGVTLADIDEIALLFPGQHEANSWIMDAVRDEDVHHFNAAFDTVNTSPIPSEYFVRYDFLSLRGRSYRIEAMQLITGTSPLHAPLVKQAEQFQVPVPVHLSFKCENEEVYQRSVYRLEQNDFEAAQRCRSTYGIFSYWKHPEFDLYIKPRVNMRDAS